MLYKFFNALFGDQYTRYTAKPAHLSIALLLLGVGTVTLGQGWYFLGFCSALFGFLLGITILLALNWDKAIDYWQTIGDVFNAMAKIKDSVTRYELLKSMGYDVLPSQVEIMEVSRENGDAFPQFKINRQPVSPAVLQMIADKVLMSNNYDFAEDQYKDIVKNFRKVKNALKADGYIRQKSNKNHRLGYTWTKRGVDVLLESASEGVKLELKRRGNV